MRGRAALWVAAGLMSALGVVGIGPVGASPGGRPATVQVGRLAPAVAPVTVSGAPFRLTAVHQPMMITFWASWCVFCRVEMPSVVRLASQAHGRYRVVAIDVTRLDSVANARRFAAANHVPSPLLLDPSGRVQAAFLVTVLPTTYFVNAKGVVVAQVLGAETYQAMQRHLHQAETL
ncbi:MAG: TlpA disulfide reductase family protein [Thermaerobacter sp.]|nr:TlpA disulfide reductase family protein [Thermaerobacter sp.]